MFDKMQKEIDRFYANADKFISKIREIDLFDADQALTALGKQKRESITVEDLDQIEALDGILRGEHI